jgi:phenylpyruvate tautomerase PptA (4-oxalocrotonate tautomerase family)
MLTTAATAVAGMSTARADPLPPAAGFGAPLAELHFPAGVLSPEQKAAMIKGVTDVLLKATNLAPDQASKLWVQLFETAEGGWGAGGQVFVPRSK